ncbi:MAG TPA: DoxX family protein [Thermoanaerobaculia bacterium]
MSNRKADVALFLLRAVVGVVFFAHGAQKVLGWFGGYGLQGTVSAMTKGGMPVIVPYLVSFGELLAGLGLIFGVLTRIAAAGMFIEMLGAVLIVHAKNGFFADKHGFEYPLTLCVASLAILILGPGEHSLDAAFTGEKTPELVTNTH